jgi:hypothetical protein
MEWDVDAWRLWRVNRFRGVLMLLAAGVAFWKGWRIRANGHSPLLAYGLCALALGLAVWHLMRREAARRA